MAPAYIANSADFAKPILAYLRESVHAALPEIEENIKWGNPHFVYKGMFASMAAFGLRMSLSSWPGVLPRVSEMSAPTLMPTPATA